MEIDFLDELLKEAEEKEEEQTEAFYDLLLMGIRKLQAQIEYNFYQAEKECQMINSFTLHKNVQLQERIRWSEMKLEAFIREKKEKTIALPNGILKVHKKPDRVEIEDMETFLKNARPEMLTVIPEQVKPDLNKIKAYIKAKPIPLGVKLIEGKEEFSYKLNKEEDDAREKETGAGSEQDPGLRIVV